MRTYRNKAINNEQLIEHRTHRLYRFSQMKIRINPYKSVKSVSSVF